MQQGVHVIRVVKRLPSPLYFEQNLLFQVGLTSLYSLSYLSCLCPIPKRGKTEKYSSYEQIQSAQKSVCRVVERKNCIPFALNFYHTDMMRRALLPR